MALPPWLQINPRDYLAAVEAGTRAGLSIRQASEQAWENAQRMQMEQQAQQERQQQLGVENQQNRLAQEQLDRYRQQQAATAAQRATIADANEKAMQNFRQAETTETARHNLVSEATASANAKGKEYGDIESLDLGDGYKAVFRKGSPGFHLVPPSKSPGLTPTAAGNLLKNLPEIDRNMKMAGTNSMAFKYGPQLLDTALGGIGPKPQTNTNAFKILSIKQRSDQSPSAGAIPTTPAGSSPTKRMTQRTSNACLRCRTF